jgi:hypothetical protein
MKAKLRGRRRLLVIGRSGVATLLSVLTHNKGQPMLTKLLHQVGVRAWAMQLVSMSAVGLCVALWIRAKTVDQDERGNAERRALFVGLWPPTLWLIGESLEELK